MSTATAEDIRKHVRVYILVFAALAVLTIVTVAVSYLDLPTGPAVLVALIIASIKASMVALYFMHLVSEKTVIYGVLILMAMFFVALMLIPVLTQSELVVVSNVP